MIRGAGLQKGVRSRRVLARNPSRRAGRYCIRLSRVLTSAVSSTRLRLARLARDLSGATRPAQSVCHSAGIVGRACACTPVIGKEGLLRLVEWAEKLRARDRAGGGASQAVRARASSPDGGDECSGRGAVEVVSGGGPERHLGIAGRAPGAVGGLGRAGGGGQRRTRPGGRGSRGWSRSSRWVMWGWCWAWRCRGWPARAGTGIS
jgi:hypothetical protein